MGCTSDELVVQWERSEALSRVADLDEARHRTLIVQVLAHRSDDVAKRFGAAHANFRRGVTP